MKDFAGPIIATHGTCELAELVLLDSGHLQEEFAKREARWEKKHPDEAVTDDQEERAAYDAALRLAENPAAATPIAPDAATIASEAASEEVAVATETGGEGAWAIASHGAGHAVRRAGRRRDRRPRGRPSPPAAGPRG